MEIIAFVLLLIVAVVACWNWYKWFIMVKVMVRYIRSTKCTLPSNEEIKILMGIVIKETLNIK